MHIVDTFKSRIQGIRTVAITTHVIPDADGIGSQIALCLALRRLGIDAICVNDEPLPLRYRYMDPDHVVLGVSEFGDHRLRHPDLWIVVDTNTVERTCPDLHALIREKGNVLYVDHHPAPHMDVRNHCMDTAAAATGELVGWIIRGLGIPFDRKLALPLYTAIIIDTSSFRYPNVTGDTHTLVGELMKTGIRPPEAYNGIYGAKKIEHMHMLGTILATAESTANGDIAWITLTKDLISRFSSDVEDTHAFINHLLILDNIKVALMFRDDGDSLKMSLRSSGLWDVGHIARELKGGGHSHSAATLFAKKPEDNLDKLVRDTVAKVETVLKGMKAQI